jgi:hypothetical protein
MNKQELILLIKECIQEIRQTKLSKVSNESLSKYDEVMYEFLRGAYGTPPKTDDLEEIEKWAAEKLKPAKNGVVVNFKTEKFRHNLPDNYAGTLESDIVDVYVHFEPAENLKTVKDAINDLIPYGGEKKPILVFWLSPEYIANAILGEDIANRIVVPGCK